MYLYDSNSKRKYLRMITVTVHLRYGRTVAAVLFEFGGKVYGNICMRDISMRDSSSVVNISYII